MKLAIALMALGLAYAGMCGDVLSQDGSRNAEAAAVVESARSLKVVAEADVVVVGGSSAGVSAAVAAADAGARVYLVAPRPYLGEDVAGTLALLPEEVKDFDDPAAQAIWTGANPRLPFTYRSLTPTVAPHQDDGKLLSDGRLEDVNLDPVQFDDETGEVLVDLGETTDVAGVAAHAFRSYGPDSQTAECTVSTSPDGKTWATPVTGVFGHNNCDFNNRTIFRIDLGVRTRYLKVAFRRAPNNSRQLVSEITVFGKPRSSVRRVPTPREVKSDLDELLIARGIPYLTGAFVTDVLGDGEGGVSGVIIANRAGRQVVRARRVIDATARGTALAAGGGRLAPLGAGARLRRMVLAAQKPEGKDLSVRELPYSVPACIQRAGRKDCPLAVTAQLYECSFACDLADDAPATWAAAEDLARTLTANTEEVDAADEVIAPERTVATPVAGLDYVGATRDYRVVREIGRKAAALAKAAGKAKTMVRRSGGGATGAALNVCERLNGLHGYDEEGLEAVTLVATGLPVLGRYDVVVLGGGSAGSSAAIGALRGGAKTLVVDYMYHLGGLSTMGMVGEYWYGFRGGFTKEIDAGILSAAYLVRRRGRIEWFRSEIRRLGGEIWFGSMGCGAVLEGDAVAGIVVATPTGRGVILAKRTIDTTGSADIAAVAGEATEFVGPGEFALQRSGTSPVLPGWTYVNTDWGYLFDNDAIDYWLNGLCARRGGWHDWDISQVPSSRERRHLVGDFTVTPLDVALNRTFRDVIARGRTDFDTHGATVSDICFASEPVGRNVYHLNVPYRTLLPAKTRALLVASLGLNVHRDAQPFVRMIPDVQNIGYAAGCAAAQSVRDKVALADIDIRKLQLHLVEIGQIPVEALAWNDEFAITDGRLAEAVKNVARKYHDAPIVFAVPARAIPLLRAAYAEATDPKAKLCYAHVLGILRDPAGAATLAEQLSKPPEARLVINDENKEAFGLCMTPFESQLVALGRTKSACAVPVIGAAIERLEVTNRLSAVRAVMLACEEMPRREFAPALAAVLRKPGFGGHARRGLAAATPRSGFVDNNNEREENVCPRELHLARALWLCGDFEGVAKRTLEAYAQDPRAAYAAHARAVLAAGASDRGP